MKIQRLAVAVLTFGAINLLAQTVGTSAGQSSVPVPTPYAITTSDANSQIWERTTYETSPAGKSFRVPKESRLLHQHINKVLHINMVYN